jgi:hypothetical protein
MIGSSGVLSICLLTPESDMETPVNATEAGIGHLSVTTLQVQNVSDSNPGTVSCFRVPVAFPGVHWRFGVWVDRRIPTPDHRKSAKRSR